MMDIRFFCVRTLPAVDTPNSRCRLRSRSKSVRRSLIVSSDVSSWPTTLFSRVQCTLLLAVARYDRVADPRHLPVGLHGHFGAVGVHVLFIGVYPGPQLSSSQGVVYSNNLPQTLVLINSLVDRVYSNTVRSRNRTYILIANMWRASRLIFVFLAGLAWARDWRKCGGTCQEWRRIKASRWRVHVTAWSQGRTGQAFCCFYPRNYMISCWAGCANWRSSSYIHRYIHSDTRWDIASPSRYEWTLCCFAKDQHCISSFHYGNGRIHTIVRSTPALKVGALCKKAVDNVSSPRW